MWKYIHTLYVHTRGHIIIACALSAFTGCICVWDGTVELVVCYQCRAVGSLVFEQEAGIKATSAELLVCGSGVLP